MKTKLLSLALVVGFASSVSAVEENEQCEITWTMRGEMFMLGAFHVKEHSGEERGTFLVNYLPGAANITHDAGRHWVHAAETLKPFLEGEKFWKNEIWGSFTKNLLWGWDTNAECGVGAIPKDFNSLWADFNSVKVGEFGAIGHRALDCLGMVASVVCRPIIGAGALAVGAIGATIVPPLKVAAKACHSFGEATVCGAGWPMLKMLWNGTAWAATQVYTQTPPEKDSIVVTWVPAKSNSATCSVHDEL